jgi:hypothetical protein
MDQLDASTGPGNLLKLGVHQLIIDTQPRLAMMRTHHFESSTTLSLPFLVLILILVL